jgi:hypothetical protein
VSRDQERATKSVLDLVDAEGLVLGIRILNNRIPVQQCMNDGKQTLDSIKIYIQGLVPSSTKRNCELDYSDQ